MSILDRITLPHDLRSLTRDELRTLAVDVRERLVDVCSRTGGHIGAGLGVVELTIALHYAFKTPRDQLVWDVGHQGYPHKLLTGRNDRMETLRQENGISGFLKRSESEYDTFGAGHAATAISAALGMAAARDINGEQDLKVVAILGDGAMSRSLAYEVLKYAGHFGPIDGHDIDALIDTFAAVREMTGPRLVHVITQKGKGFPAGEHTAGEKWHALPPGHDPATGKQLKTSAANPNYTAVFGKGLTELATDRKSVV